MLLIQPEDRQAMSEQFSDNAEDDGNFSDASSNLMCPQSMTVKKPKPRRNTKAHPKRIQSS